MLRKPIRPSALIEETHDVADRLHSLAIHLLRRLRRVDVQSPLTAPRLSALSVLVFGGPVSLGALADAEQVSRPTMTRIVQGLGRGGYVRRRADPMDARIIRIEATDKGVRVMRQGRERRVQMLADLLLELPSGELRSIRQAVFALESVVAGRRTASR